VTSAARDASSSDIADYNAFATGVADSVASLSALGTTWTAIVPTATVDARDNAGTNPFVATGVPIYNLAGMLVASDNADLWDGFLTNPISVDETGTIPDTPPWTGTDVDGTGRESFALGTGIAVIGESRSAGPDWIRLLATTDQTPQPLYAISGTLTVVSEPGIAVLLAPALAWLRAARRRERTA